MTRARYYASELVPTPRPFIITCLQEIIQQVRIALEHSKLYIEIAFWCHGGKQRSVAVGRTAQHILTTLFGNQISVPPIIHEMRYWWSWIPCQVAARKDRNLTTLHYREYG